MANNPEKTQSWHELASVYVQKEAWQKVIDCYKQALVYDPKNSESYIFRMAHAQFQNNEIDNAINNYKRVLSLNPNHVPAYKQIVRAYQRKHLFNPRVYFVNHNHKIIYCRIPKNACTLFTTTIVETSQEKEHYQQSGFGPHDYLSKYTDKLRIADFSIFKNPEYFKFVILRNPLERIVSGYLDKFAKTKRFEKFAKKVIMEVHDSLGIKNNLEQSITFSQFVDYLLQTEDYLLDAHWRPQHTFLSNDLFEFNFYGCFEFLDDSVDYLEKNLNIKFRKNVSDNVKRGHVTQYKEFKNRDKFNDTYPEELRRLGGFPKANQMYTQEIEELVRTKYGKDIEIYESKFGVKIKNYYS